MDIDISTIIKNSTEQMQNIYITYSNSQLKKFNYKNMKTILKVLFFLTISSSVYSCKIQYEEVLVWNDPPSSTDTTYINPVFQPDLADPTIVRGNDGWFYAYGTQNDWSNGLVRITPIVRSKDMVKWDYVGDVFATPPTWKSDGGVWAPNINFYNGRYYLYYSKAVLWDTNPGIGVAVADYPYGPFTDLGKVLDTKSIGIENSIDPFFIETGSGRYKVKYLFWGSFRGIYGIQLADDMKTTVGEKFQIAGNAFEGTYIYMKDNMFYFFGSCGNCCDGADSKYRVTVAASSNIKGPYLTKEGKNIIQNGVEGTLFLQGDAKTGFVGPGHNGEIIKDDSGRYFMVYHAVDITKPLLPNGATRRPLMIDEVKWANGWPYIEGNVPSHSKTKAPTFK